MKRSGERFYSCSLLIPEPENAVVLPTGRRRRSAGCVIWVTISL